MNALREHWQALWTAVGYFVQFSPFNLVTSEQRRLQHQLVKGWQFYSGLLDLWVTHFSYL